MNIVQEIFSNHSGWENIFQKGRVKKPQLVLVFGKRELVSQNHVYDDLKNKYPNPTETSVLIKINIFELLK